MLDYKEQRIEICNRCEKQWIKFTTKICGECGCIIQIKASIKSFKCPLGKWDADDNSK